MRSASDNDSATALHDDLEPQRFAIALVDDDRNILTSVSMALEAEGFRVRCYADGAEALRGLTSQPADVV